MATTLVFDGKEYQIDSLSDAAKAQVQNINFIDSEVLRLQNSVTIYQTARRIYLSALKKELEGATE